MDHTTTEILDRVRVTSAECYDEPAPFGNLVDVNTKETIRPATQAEECKSLARAAREGWPGVIIVENRACFVDY